ncbi:MAG: glycoside hydrolase [candidate division Zixibacteria bacterium]|nr:glycoside hydrolase [candidate division Zixibacteria bacterium]
MSDKAGCLKVVFLWHMHQPYYKDYHSGEYQLPWVRLHGLKDYLDMAAILDDFPGIKQTFNYVPSLIRQVQDYTENGAVDSHLRLSRKKVDELSEADKLEILKTFFSANYATMIQPFPEYDRLYKIMQAYKSDLSQAVNKLTEQEYFDLTVLSNLAWIDPSFRHEQKIKDLYSKKKNYTYEERDKLLEFQLEILRRIIPKHKEIQDRGQIEVSFSPYYHPILPLLIDTDLAKESMPRVQLPKHRFTHPEDARAQISKSKEMYSQLFDRQLRGMWPSEGSVAEKLLPIMAENDIRWIATDEEIFYNSLKHSQLSEESQHLSPNFHRPYKLSRNFGEVGIIFRDHRLSDRIGFVYSTWDADKAAIDLVNHLASIRTLMQPSEISEHVIPIILDGENAWEYYKNDGQDFLHCLYKLLSTDQRFQTVTVSELFDEVEKPRNIPYLFAGSWIGHNFKIWIGHEEDNRAWDLLSMTRNALVDFSERNPDFDPDKLAEAWEEIYIAEGSDWCWWYGDEHSSNEDDLFDQIFRSHLMAVYSIIDEDPPRELLQPIRSREGEASIIQPSNFFSAKIDGEVTHFYEWYDAGSFNCRKASSTMHRVSNIVEEIFFGFDNDNLYYRLDLIMPASDEALEDYEFELEIHTINSYRLRLSQDKIEFAIRQADKDKYTPLEFGGQVFFKNIVELSIPRTQIEFDKDFEVNLRVRVSKDNQAVETWPAMNLIKYQAPTEDKSIFWQV